MNNILKIIGLGFAINPLSFNVNLTELWTLLIGLSGFYLTDYLLS